MKVVAHFSKSDLFCAIEPGDCDGRSIWRDTQFVPLGPSRSFQKSRSFDSTVTGRAFPPPATQSLESPGSGQVRTGALPSAGRALGRRCASARPRRGGGRGGQCVRGRRPAAAPNFVVRLLPSLHRAPSLATATLTVTVAAAGGAALSAVATAAGAARSPHAVAATLLCSIAAFGARAAAGRGTPGDVVAKVTTTLLTPHVDDGAFWGGLRGWGWWRLRWPLRPASSRHGGPIEGGVDRDAGRRVRTPIRRVGGRSRRGIGR